MSRREATRRQRGVTSLIYSCQEGLPRVPSGPSHELNVATKESEDGCLDDGYVDAVSRDPVSAEAFLNVISLCRLESSPPTNQLFGLPFPSVCHLQLLRVRCSRFITIDYISVRLWRRTRSACSTPSKLSESSRSKRR
jgi:hypothetical protein